VCKSRQLDILSFQQYTIIILRIQENKLARFDVEYMKAAEYKRVLCRDCYDVCDFFHEFCEISLNILWME
jgi:hypothetical protein